MHKWCLLLFALLAVLEPIASFTERNLVDGREPCCGRDSRLAYETRTKPSEDRRISRGVREDHRYEITRTIPANTRLITERRLGESHFEKDIRRLAPETTRSIRSDIRREHGADKRYERFSTMRDDRTRRISYRQDNREQRERENLRINARESVRQQDRVAREPARNRQIRDTTITRNLGTERSFRTSVEPRRETRWNRDNSEQRRVQATREARDVLQRTRTDVANNEESMARLDRRVVRERTDERRARSESRLELNREQRALRSRVRETSGDRRLSMDQIRDERRESRIVRGYPSRHTQQERRVTSPRETERRVINEERGHERRVSREMNIRRETRERMSHIRDSDRARSDIRNIRTERADTRRDSRRDERRMVSREQRVENYRTDSRMRDRETWDRVMERRDRRSADRLDIRDNRRDVRLFRSQSVDIREREGFDEHRLNNRMEREARFRSNPEFFKGRHSIAAFNAKTTDDHSATSNWQYIFYTLQGIYLCGILMQMLSQNNSGKKPRALSWLSVPQKLIKID